MLSHKEPWGTVVQSIGCLQASSVLVLQAVPSIAVRGSRSKSELP